MAARAPKILVVEPDQSLRGLLVLILVDAGYEVREVRGTPQALAVAEAWRPDLIVLDAGRDGQDAGTFRRATWQVQAEPVPILLLSDSLKCPRTQGLGPVAVVSKPFLLDEFFAALRLLQHREV